MFPLDNHQLLSKPVLILLWDLVCPLIQYYGRYLLHFCRLFRPLDLEYLEKRFFHGHPSRLVYRLVQEGQSDLTNYVPLVVQRVRLLPCLLWDLAGLEVLVLPSDLQHLLSTRIRKIQCFAYNSWDS